MPTYLLVGMQDSPEAEQASNLVVAMFAGDDDARYPLADLLEQEQASQFLPGILRDPNSKLTHWGDGSINLIDYNDEGDYKYVWVLGWHAERAAEYEEMCRG